ncbi:MAG: hypothetical protein ACI8Y4_000931 [Candidatus Poriferisodalaceae bacterium]|jgi:hypothetical protein
MARTRADIKQLMAGGAGLLMITGAGAGVFLATSGGASTQEPATSAHEVVTEYVIEEVVVPNTDAPAAQDPLIITLPAPTTTPAAGYGEYEEEDEDDD